MPGLTLALLLAALAVVSFSRTSGATNYHEYKKFNLSGPVEQEPIRRHSNPREHRNYCHCDKWRDFLHHD